MRYIKNTFSILDYYLIGSLSIWDTLRMPSSLQVPNITGSRSASLSSKDCLKQENNEIL